jgi:hypothetical protein
MERIFTLFTGIGRSAERNTTKDRNTASRQIIIVEYRAFGGPEEVFWGEKLDHCRMLSFGGGAGREY